jgi:hypothetical protein
MAPLSPKRPTTAPNQKAQTGPRLRGRN